MIKISSIKKLATIIVMVLCAGIPVETKASSQDACAIWLCLPSGFPSGCSGALSEFKHRIKKGRPPLPVLSSCTTGPNGGHVSGRYELGLERFEPCDDQYVLRERRITGVRIIVGTCYLEVCAPAEQGGQKENCQNYEAVKRVKPNYLKMWVDGDYLGQFFY